jgi:antitoxin (DNA-binding transcriptional repressor) of toxin-antitoxin stability system
LTLLAWFWQKNGIISTMAVIHISAADASRDFPALLARARAGAEIVIEDNDSPAVILRLSAERSVRLLSESLRLAKEHGSNSTLDGGFARDLEDAINGHPEPLGNPWD